MPPTTDPSGRDAGNPFADYRIINRTGALPEHARALQDLYDSGGYLSSPEGANQYRVWADLPRRDFVPPLYVSAYKLMNTRTAVFREPVEALRPQPDRIRYAIMSMTEQGWVLLGIVSGPTTDSDEWVSAAMAFMTEEMMKQ